MGWKRLATTALVVLVAVAGRAPGVAAAVPRGAGATPPRLSFTDGEVSFWRPGAEDWAPAKVNTPLAAGDSLYTGENANLELQVGPSAFVRAGAGTELGFESLEPDLQQFKLTTGHAAVDVRRLPRGQAIEVDTPNGAFTIDHPGYYRIDVEQERTTFSTRRGGEATLVPADGEATDVGSDKQLVLEGTDTPQLSTSAAPDPDDWDRWNLDRTGRPSEPSPSAAYVSPEVAGSEDLDRHGDWRDTPRYGHVWVPHEVPPDWAPYSTGRWVWDPYYGWTWVDDAPWGWAPYHYGRWVYVNGFWGWAPGPVVAAPVYAPALVAFFGAPGVGVSVSVGVPFVSWVALGFGEPVIPWWGPVGFVGTCWWGGWGGPRFVNNNVVIQHNTYVNVRNVTVFQNTHVHNAVIAVQRDHFGRGHVEHVRLGAADAQRLRPIHGRLGVKPTPASLVAKEGHAIRPPQAVHARPVVATRPPQDLSHRLRAAGLNPASSAAPPPRLVHAPRPQGGGRQASFGSRATPPPPPGAGHRRLEAGARPAPPSQHTHGERPNLGPPRAPAAPRAPTTAERRPHGGARAAERGTPPALPHDAERRPAERAAPPPPPHHAERARPAPPAPARRVERERPARGAPPPQLGAPPPRAPHEGTHAPRPQPAPHEKQHQGPGGAPPSARWEAPRAPHAWTQRPARSASVRERGARPSERRAAGAESPRVARGR
ncbi:MAG: hypothetical protein E6J59_08900 [Deltaproteobacteria bacterium]|nr:MAG: hypothetical protein E6J59_08900 [Deltaproteobacteria bacterium]